MADHDYDHNSDDEDQGEIHESYYKTQKDALLFAIQVSDSMLEPPPPSDNKKASRDNAVTAALKSAYKVMQQRIISNPKDKMGILLFGTERTKYIKVEGMPSSMSYPHCYDYLPLDVPSAEEVKQLRNLVEDQEDEDDVLVPSSEGVRIADVLFCAIQIFTHRAPNFGSRRLFIITDNDDPHPGDAKEAESAVTRAGDLSDIDVAIEIFPITHGGAKFDLTKFYDDIVHHDAATEVLNPNRFNISKVGDMDSLIKNINSKQTPKRAYFSNMKFELGPGMTISVSGYNVIHQQTAARTCYIWLDGERAQMATSETARLSDDTLQVVQKVEVKKAYKFGGEYVHFSPEELKDIKQWGDPIIRIIGFKDRSLLKFWMSMKKGIFIFPNEYGYVGSTRVFSALWQKLIKSKKIGIAWHVARTNANPVLVAVIPSRSQDDEDSGTRFLPAGLWLCPIPYADDVRPAPESEVVRATGPLIDGMNKVVRNLQLPEGRYDPMKYPNPALQWHYRILQALALEDEVPTEPEDKTVPKAKAIHKRIGGHIEDWSALADEELAKHEQERHSIKRGFYDDEDKEDEHPVKKARKAAVKSANVDDAMSEADVKKQLKAGTISKLKVADLKAILQARGLETKGLKANLVERLEQWGEENM